MAENEGFGDLVQQLEQFATSMENIAELQSTYFKSLKKKGFTREEALALTMEYSNIFWHRILDTQQNDPH